MPLYSRQIIFKNLLKTNLLKCTEDMQKKIVDIEEVTPLLVFIRFSALDYCCVFYINTFVHVLKIYKYTYRSI